MNTPTITEARPGRPLICPVSMLAKMIDMLKSDATNDSEVEAFFDQVKIESLTSDEFDGRTEMIFTVPNAYVRDWISQRYGVLLEYALAVMMAERRPPEWEIKVSYQVSGKDPINETTYDNIALLEAFSAGLGGEQ